MSKNCFFKDVSEDLLENSVTTVQVYDRDTRTQEQPENNNQDDSLSTTETSTYNP